MYLFSFDVFLVLLFYFGAFLVVFTPNPSSTVRHVGIWDHHCGARDTGATQTSTDGLPHNATLVKKYSF